MFGKYSSWRCLTGRDVTNQVKDHRAANRQADQSAIILTQDGIEQIANKVHRKNDDRDVCAPPAVPPRPDRGESATGSHYEHQSDGCRADQLEARASLGIQ